MNEEFREYLEKNVFQSFAKQALKPILLAYKDITTNIQIQDFKNFANEDFLENNLVLLALIGIKDPLRDDVAEAVSLCIFE